MYDAGIRDILYTYMVYIYIYIYICSNVKSSNVKSKLMKTRCRNVFKTYI